MVTLNQSLDYLRGNRGPIAFDRTEDWCVLRLDKDDRTLEVYWSEPNAPYYQTSASQSSAGGMFRGWGGHAEMNLIRDWAQVLARYGRTPDTVEIFISRSPCSRSLADNVGGVGFPLGCAAKLRKLVERNPNVNVWKIVYDEVFSGPRPPAAPNLQAQATAEREIGLLNRHARIEALLWQEYAQRL